MYNNGRLQPLALIGGGVGLETIRHNNTLHEINNQQFEYVQQQHQYVNAQQPQHYYNNTDSASEYPSLGSTQQNKEDTADYRFNMPQYMYDSCTQPHQQQYQQQQQQQDQQQPQHLKHQQQQQQRYQQHHQQYDDRSFNRSQQQQQQQQRRDEQQQHPHYPQRESHSSYHTNIPHHSDTARIPHESYQSYRANPAYYYGTRTHPLFPTPEATRTAHTAPSHQQPLRQQNGDPRLGPRVPPPPPAELKVEPGIAVTAGPRGVSGQRRTPPTFRAPWLLDDLVRHDQLARHLGNWERFPESLGRRLDDLMTDIKPPLPDNELKAELATVAKECRAAIKEVVVQHLRKQSNKITDRLYECDGLPEHIQEVKKLAFETIKRRFGRLNRDSIDGLNRITKMFGNGVTQANSLKPNLVKIIDNSDRTCTLLSRGASVVTFGGNIGNTAVTDGVFAHHEEMDVADAIANSLVETENIIRPSAKKMLLYNVKTNNRFDSLTEAADSPGKRKRLMTPESTPSPVAKEPRTITPALQNLPTSPNAAPKDQHSTSAVEQSSQSQASPSSPHHTQRTIGARRAVNPKITITVSKESSEKINKGKLTVHREGQNFALELDSKVSTLIIGSSNLRNTPETDIEVDNHIICIPGANLQYVTTVVNELNELISKGELKELQHVVVTTGLNNRDDTELPPIADQLHALDKLQGGVAGIYMGISADMDKLTDLQKQNVEFINNSGITRENRYIEPLASCKFSRNIHYDDETTHHVIERINEFIQDFQYD
jgi:hypothetical protein